MDRAPSLEPYLKIDGRKILADVMGTFERYKPTEAPHEDYLLSIEGERFGESMRYVRSCPEQLPI
jgi:hypothetical protein